MTGTQNTTSPQAVAAPFSRTVHDETHRGVQYLEPEIASLGMGSNLLGHLPYHSPDTDGSFGICVAGGEGVFISKALLDSIPQEHRPTLDEHGANITVNFSVIGTSAQTLGSVLFPFILTAQSGERIRIVLYALVLPQLSMGMFLSDFHKNGIIESYSFGGPGPSPAFVFKFGQELIPVTGKRL